MLPWGTPEWIWSDKSCRENQNAHFLFNNSLKIRAVYEIKCKKLVHPDRPHITIWRMCISCWIPKPTNTLSECVIIIVFRCNNSCMKAPQCYVSVHCLVLYMFYFNNSISQLNNVTLPLYILRRLINVYYNRQLVYSQFS